MSKETDNYLEVYGDDYFTYESFYEIPLNTKKIVVPVKFDYVLDTTAVDLIKSIKSPSVESVQSIINYVNSLSKGPRDVEDCQYLSTVFALMLDKVGVENSMSGSPEHVYNVFNLMGKEYKIDFAFGNLSTE